MAGFTVAVGNSSTSGTTRKANDVAVKYTLANGITLAAMSSDRIQWPPSGIQGAASIDSDFPIGIQWQSDSETNGVYQIGAVILSSPSPVGFAG